MIDPHYKEMNEVSNSSVSNKLVNEGFLHLVDDEAVVRIRAMPEFDDFVNSWNNLPMDTYLFDQGRYRYRRYSVFTIKNNELIQLPYEPHYQTQEYNRVHGGINRHYSELRHSVVQNPVFREIINLNLAIIGKRGHYECRIQCHQFRISASAHELGKPSPEGVHQDGAEYVSIMLIDRSNVTGAENTINDEHGNVRYRATMARQGEIIMVNDRRHWHGVSDISPVNPDEKAYRDVLVLTFHKL